MLQHQQHPLYSGPGRYSRISINSDRQLHTTQKPLSVDDLLS